MAGQRVLAPDADQAVRPDQHGRVVDDAGQAAFGHAPDQMEAALARFRRQSLARWSGHGFGHLEKAVAAGVAGEGELGEDDELRAFGGSPIEIAEPLVEGGRLVVGDRRDLRQRDLDLHLAAS